MDCAVFFCVEGAVLAVEMLRRHGKHETIMIGAVMICTKAGSVIAAIGGVRHALGEGAGSSECRQRIGVLAVPLLVSVFSSQHHPHVSECLRLRIGSRRVASE